MYIQIRFFLRNKRNIHPYRNFNFNQLPYSPHPHPLNSKEIIYIYIYTTSWHLPHA